MKHDVLVICLALVLAACQPIPVSQATSTAMPLTPTNTPTPTFTLIPPTSTSTPSPSPEPTLSPDINEKNEFLVYVARIWDPMMSSKPQLTLYDPANNKTQILSTNVSHNNFSISKNNRLAFEKDENIYVWDYPFKENTPTKITFDGSPATQMNVLSWSLDGRYLPFTKVQGDSKKLFLWDGKNILDLYSYQGVISSHGTSWTNYDGTAWSNNGKLAFTEDFIDNRGYASFLGKIFVWDGKDVVNVSQNPSGFPAWSKDGQLAFLSSQNGEYTISVWDGKSKNNGAPDVKTIADPDLEFFNLSQPTWTNSGSIVFMGRGKTGGKSQIYEWDGQTIKNISQTPSIDFYALAWRIDGYWSSLVNLGSTVIVRDNANQTVLETRGDDSEWTQSGLLVFCNSSETKWTLSIWNGKNIVDVAQGDDVYAKWTNSNGKSIECTYG